MENYFFNIHQRPFVIAEMSGNHNASLDRALAIVDEAAKAGAHALKIQTYTADTMTIDCDSADFVINQANSLWHGRSLYDLYKEASTPWEWHQPILERCQRHGMLFFSTPFDESAVDFLESLAVPFYKIASFELTDIPLIKKVASCRKPMIMSTGMATREEIEEAVLSARSSGASHIALLKCTSTYPASPLNSNIRTIPELSRSFQTEVGLSDHTLGIGVAVASVALGATVIEKHFTLRRADGGVDAEFSMEPQEFKALVEESGRAFQGLGQMGFGPSKAELGSLKFRRSVYAVADIQEGELLTSKNVKVIRPGYGLPPRDFEDLLGKRAAKSIRRGTPISIEVIR